MEENTSASASGWRKPPWRLFLWILGLILTLFVLLLFCWWMTARIPSGYLVPASEGVIAETPGTLELLWARPSPWSTTPPSATVTFRIGDEKISETGVPDRAPMFSGRVVPVSLSLFPVRFRRSGLVSRITVRWAGGSTFARESGLWAVHAQESRNMPGFQVLPDGRLVVLLAKVPEEVVAVAAPDPTTGPWLQPSCASETNASTALTGASRRIARVQRSLTPAACSNLRGPQAIVQTGRAPQTPVAFYWDGIVEELTHGRALTVTGGNGEQGWGEVPNPLNWTWFLASGH